MLLDLVSGVHVDINKVIDKVSIILCGLVVLLQKDLIVSLVVVVVMVFRRRMSNLRPINSLKHVVDTSFTMAANTQVDTQVMDAVPQPTITTPRQTTIASKISSMYLRVEAAVDIRIAGAIPNFYMIVFKNPGTNFTVPNAASVGTSDIKRFVIHQEMVMLDNSTDAPNPRTIFNGVIKIPRGFQRQGNDDSLQVGVLCPSLTSKVCIQCIFKEYK